MTFFHKNCQQPRPPDNFDAANQLTKVDGQSYTYDPIGGYDLKDDGTKTYAWDADGRLTEVRKKSDNSLIAQYEYDADGRRVKSIVGGVVTNYHYDGNGIQVLYETDGSGNLTNLYTHSSNGLLLSLTKSGQTYYYHYNGHGDVVQLTDFSGNVVASYTYDAWGNILQSSGTMAASNPYRYAGYKYDSETGMYYLMARYYPPNLGRFISRDAIDSINLYAYCENNPVNYVDPSGLITWDLGSGWKVRLDKGKSSTKTQDHVHVDGPGGKQWSQNEDGSIHDKGKNSPGQPPGWVKKKLKEKANWNWDKNAENHKKNVTNKTIAVGGGLGAGYIVYRGIRLLPSFAPPLWPSLLPNLALP